MFWIALDLDVWFIDPPRRVGHFEQRAVEEDVVGATRLPARKRQRTRSTLRTNVYAHNQIVSTCEGQIWGLHDVRKEGQPEDEISNDSGAGIAT